MIININCNRLALLLARINDLIIRRNMMKKYIVLTKNLALSYSEIQELGDRRLRRLIDHAYHKTIYYRKVLNKLDLDHELALLESLRSYNKYVKMHAYTDTPNFGRR